MSKMLTKLTKGQQLTIPAFYRHKLGIDESTLLDIDLDEKRKRIIVEPIETQPLEMLFKKWDKVKLKTRKSIKELEDEYIREQMLHGY